MEEKEVSGKVGYVNIDMADNGWVVSYDISYPSKKGDPYSCTCQSHKKIFEAADEDEAWEFFKKLKIKSMSK